MTTRARKIAWMKEQGYSETDKAIDMAIREFGMGWFTDEQIADMASLLVAKYRDSMHLTLRNRRILKEREKVSA